MDERTHGTVDGGGLLSLARFELDTARRELRGPDGALAGLRRQSMDVLCVLAADAGHVVAKETLMRQVWPQVVVGDDSLAQAIADIRRVLGDVDHRLVRTVARRGYLLVPDPSPDGVPAVARDASPAPRPASRSVDAAPAPAIGSGHGTGATAAPAPGSDEPATGSPPAGPPPADAPVSSVTGSRASVSIAPVSSATGSSTTGLSTAVAPGPTGQPGGPGTRSRHGARAAIGVATSLIVVLAIAVAALRDDPREADGARVASTRPAATPATAPGAGPGPSPAAAQNASLRSLVVLPLADDATAPGSTWFADALTGELTARLSRWPDMLVIGRGTAAKYQGRSDDPRDVARELGVSHVIRGAVRRDGDAVRVELALLDGASGMQLWTQRYDAPRAELDRALDDLAGGIMRTLVGELGRSIGRRIATLEPAQVQADDLAMQGFWAYLRGMTPESFAESTRLFELAVAKDPDSIRALSGLAMGHAMSVIFHWAPDMQASAQRAGQALERLETLDPYGLLTLLAKATVLNMRSDWPGLLAVSSTLIEHYPGESASYHNRCSALLRLGRFEEGVTACERALRISPRESRVAVWHGLIAMNRFMQGRHDEAVAHVRQTVTGNPRLPFYWLLLAVSLEATGQPDDARRTMTTFRTRFPDFDIGTVPALWPAEHPAFVAGRDRIAEIARRLDPG
jgi:TolB-like protein/DNA-binding winged helix-turn-helix (wHTH) protein